jgi:hypothetical protein
MVVELAGASVVVVSDGSSVVVSPDSVVIGSPVVLELVVAMPVVDALPLAASFVVGPAGSSVVEPSVVSGASSPHAGSRARSRATGRRLESVCPQRTY